MTCYLSADDIALLKKWGNAEEDIFQIQTAVLVSTYTVNDKICGALKARKLLGDERFLSGISRSAFHVDSGRYDESHMNYVGFDSSILFSDRQEDIEEVNEADIKAERHLNKLLNRSLK